MKSYVKNYVDQQFTCTYVYTQRQSPEILVPQRREDETVADNVTMCGRVALPGGSGRLAGVFDRN